MQLLSCVFIILIFITINVECSYSNLKQFDNDPWRGVSMLCSSEDPTNISISCHGVRIVKRVIQQLLERASNVRSIEIIDGVKLVDSIDESTRRARNLDNSIFGFFEDRELRVKLSALMPHIVDIYTNINYSESRGHGGINFGGGKKGGNNIFYLALMMGKMLFVLGFSTLAFVSMKALMASSLALMLSLIVAAKKYASGSGSGGGGGSNDGGYHVVYAHEGHHEKRSIDNIELSPYRGWINNRDSIKLDSTR